MHKGKKRDGNLFALGYRREFESSILKGTRTRLPYQLKDGVILPDDTPFRQVKDEGVTNDDRQTY